MRWKKAHHSRMMRLVSRHIYCTDGSSPTGPGWALIVIQMCLQARHSGIHAGMTTILCLTGLVYNDEGWA